MLLSCQSFTNYLRITYELLTNVFFWMFVEVDSRGRHIGFPIIWKIKVPYNNKSKGGLYLSFGANIGVSLYGFIYIY